MKIFGLGTPELIVILVIVLLLFGWKTLPKLGSSIGKTISNLREGMKGEDSEKTQKEETVTETVEVLEETTDDEGTTEVIEEVVEEEVPKKKVVKKVVKK